MKPPLFILLILISIITAGQKPTKASTNVYKQFPEFTLLSSIKINSFPLKFITIESYFGWDLRLNKDSSFQLREQFDCTEDSIWAVGKWAIKGSTLYLEASKFKKSYDIIGFDGYTYLVGQTERKQFLKDYRATKENFKVEPASNLNRMIFLHLQEKYLHNRVLLGRS